MASIITSLYLQDIPSVYNSTIPDCSIASHLDGEAPTMTGLVQKASGKREEDMLQAFIDSKYRSTGRALADHEITGLLIAALFAGQHTSSITSIWTGAYLLT